MEDKRAYEAFRVRQFAGPHPALQLPSNPPGVADEAATLNDSAALSGAQVGTAAADPRSVSLVPDHDRVILHFDVDCFYAQGEVHRQHLAAACSFHPMLQQHQHRWPWWLQKCTQPWSGICGSAAAGACMRRPVLVHVCFAVEECRNPSLRGQPLAVTQKYLVVTANYPARAAGVTK
jgi:hypothetical protein